VNNGTVFDAPGSPPGAFCMSQFDFDMAIDSNICYFYVKHISFDKALSLVLGA